MSLSTNEFGSKVRHCRSPWPCWPLAPSVRASTRPLRRPSAPIPRSRRHQTPSTPRHGRSSAALSVQRWMFPRNGGRYSTHRNSTAWCAKPSKQPDTGASHRPSEGSAGRIQCPHWCDQISHGDGNISVQREQVDLATFGVPFPSPPPFGLLNGSVAVSYALDIFGANRRLIEGLNAQVEYQKLGTAGRTTDAGRQRGLRRNSPAQLRSQIDLTRQMLDAATARTDHHRAACSGGWTPQYEINRQRTLVEQTRASIPPLEQQLDVVTMNSRSSSASRLPKPKSRASLSTASSSQDCP